MEDAALLNDGGAVHPRHGFPSFTATISHHGLQPILRTHPAFPETMHEGIPGGFAFSIGQLPIENLAPTTAIRPQAQRNEHHYFRGRCADAACVRVCPT
jgi:hypothetical protein